VAKASPGIRFNEHIEGDGPTVFAHACKLGLEGIVSKRKDSMYRSGRSPDWLKMKNPAAPAVKSCGRIVDGVGFSDKPARPVSSNCTSLRRSVQRFGAIVTTPSPCPDCTIAAGGYDSSGRTGTTDA
jgi:hypothetical protein